MVIYIALMMPLQSFIGDSISSQWEDEMMMPPPKPGKPAEDGKGAFVLNPITKKSKVYGMMDGMRICKIIKHLTINRMMMAK